MVMYNQGKTNRFFLGIPYNIQKYIADIFIISTNILIFINVITYRF